MAWPKDPAEPKSDRERFEQDSYGLDSNVAYQNSVSMPMSVPCALPVLIFGVCSFAHVHDVCARVRMHGL